MKLYVILNDLHWVAGLLEGEGCFGYYPMGRSLHYYPRIQLTMTDEDVVRRVGKLWNQPINGPYKPRTAGGKHKWVVAASGSKAVGWMMMLYPFMGARRKGSIRRAIQEWRKIPNRSLGRPVLKGVKHDERVHYSERLTNTIS